MNELINKDNEWIIHFMGSLDRLLDNGTLAYSQINHKTYYRPEDVQRIVSVVEDRRKEAKFKGRTI